MARMERRGRRLGLVAIHLAFALAIVGIWTWALTAWPMFDYWVFPSLLPTYGIVGLAALIAVWLLLLRRTGAHLATLIAGIIVVLAGFGLGLSPPITSDGQSGWCKSVFGGIGLHGDDREDCFDARAARADDVAIVLSFGLVVSAAGSALIARQVTKRAHRNGGGEPGRAQLRC